MVEPDNGIAVGSSHAKTAASSIYMNALTIRVLRGRRVSWFKNLKRVGEFFIELPGLSNFRRMINLSHLYPCPFQTISREIFRSAIGEVDVLIAPCTSCSFRHDERRGRDTDGIGLQGNSRQRYHQTGDVD